VNDAGWVVVVDDGDDPLAEAVHEALRSAGAASFRLHARALARTRVEVTVDEARVRRRRVRAVLFRATPGGDLAAGFHSDDVSFSSNEARASWLALLNATSVVAVNRADPEVWFALADWPVWRRRLAAAGVPLAPLAVGDVDIAADACWLPWGGGITRPKARSARRAFGAAVVPTQTLTRVLAAGGHVVDGADGEGVRAAAHALSAWGVSLAGVLVDEAGRVVSATAFPPVPRHAAPAAARHITEVLTADLHGR
jgi:hypothetical protein